MYFPISYAGFFAKSQIMFFLLSSFRICPPLKNDGRGEWHFQRIFHLFCEEEKNINRKPPPRIQKGKAMTKEENKNLISVKNKIKIYLIKIYVISKE